MSSALKMHWLWLLTICLTLIDIAQMGAQQQDDAICADDRAAQYPCEAFYALEGQDAVQRVREPPSVGRLAA